MEKLNSDEKMSILMNLNGNEIIRVCNTSKSMARICSDDRYSTLWKQKILQEFNEKYIGSEKGYDRYKFLRKLYSTEFFLLIITENGHPDNVEFYLFDKIEKAIGFTRDLLEIYTYSQVKSAFDIAYFIRTESYLYVIDKIRLAKVEEDYMKEEEQHQKEKSFIKNLYKGENFENLFKSIIREINEYTEGWDRENLSDHTGEVIDVLIEEFIEENNFEGHEDEVESYIRKNILIPY